MASPAPAIEAFLLPGGVSGDARLLALWHPPAGVPRGLVVYAHPFAEEMNKSRRMAALQARALAAGGLGVLQIDLKGCGDSSGEFSDATWADWLADVRSAVGWLRQRADGPGLPRLPKPPPLPSLQKLPITLWGLRAGCLVLAEAAAQMPEECFDFLFWQPTTSGAGVLRQFLRTAAAAAFLDGGGKGVVDGLRRQLAAGQSVEVGGYRLHPALAAGLEDARLAVPPRVGRLTWLEVSALVGDSADPVPLSPSSVTASTPWRQQAGGFEVRLVSGPPFWQTAEIETAPALLDATTAALTASPSALRRP